MQSPTGGEMTLREFVESTWFKGLSRGAMLLGVPALTAISGFVGYTLNSVTGEQNRLRTEVAQIQQVQAQRADVNDKFQADVTTDLANVKTSVFTVQTDVATIKGILQQMQRQSLASTSPTALPPYEF